MKTKLTCPHCRREQLARIARRGFLRQKLFPAFGFYPWECSMCRRQFLLRKRGGVYRKSSQKSSPVQEQTSPAGMHASR
jgi:ribosomal protein L37AE/L43A